MLRLLVAYSGDQGAHPLEDTADTAWTIGANNFEHDGEDEWRFAGWCWSHDHFTEGSGRVVGWLPFHASAPGEPERSMGAARDVLDVVPLIAGALLHDRQHWRETAACHIDSLVRAIEGDGYMHRRPKVAKSALVQELRETVHSLATSLEGDYFPACEACGQMVYPDDVRLPCTDVDMHADCGAPESVKAGDLIPVPAEQVEIAEGVDYPGYVVAYAQGVLFTDAQIADRVARAQMVLRGRGEGQ